LTYSIMNKKGVALFIVIGVIMLVILAANTILNVILSQTRLARHETGRIQAFYAAKSGIYHAIEQLSRQGYCPAGPCQYTLVDAAFPNSVISVIINIGDVGTGINGTRRVDSTATFTY